MKKYLIITIAILTLLASCSTADKYDLSQIKSDADLLAMLEKMKQDKVKIDSSYLKEIIGQGMHYKGIPVSKLTINKAKMSISTDSTDYSAKKLLEQLETENGFGTLEKSYYGTIFKWENESKTTQLDLIYVDGKHLANMGEKDYAELYITFSKQYDIPLANVHKKVEKFDTEPIYELVVKSYDCDYSITLDNDVILKKKGEHKDDYNKIALNPYLFKSGKHNITLDILPEYSKTKFSKSAEISAAIKDKNTGKIVSFKITGRELPTLTSKRKFNFSIDFDANIPYNSKGWKEGKDLRKEPLLKEKIITLYDKLGNAFLNKNEKAISDLFYDMTLETVQANYNNDYKNSRKIWEELLSCKEETYKYSTAQDFNIDFRDNGKLIHATPKTKSNMLITTGKLYSKSFDFYLYQPTNSNDLKIIRQ